METLERYRRNRRVIDDFTARTLAAIPGDYARLVYVASLREGEQGYRHDGLAARFPEDSVGEALRFCHEELFARVLEMPLERQEWDLRHCLAGMPAGFWEVVREWRAKCVYQAMVPGDLPDYLGELFCSNVSTLLTLYTDEAATPAPAT
jgi:hypothetical protein